MSEKEKYSELRWYLPPYFKDNLAKCRFEQGTIIYKDKPIGENWGEKIKNIDYLIQIKFPPSAIGIESAMFSHWDSEVIFEIFYPKTKQKKTIKTTQGKLFTFLWKDNPEILDDTEPLLPPLYKIPAKFINKDFVLGKIPVGNVGFAFIYNSVNDISISKLNNIKKETSDFDIEELTFSIEESCMIRETERTNGIYPLLKTKLLLFKETKKEFIHELLKNAVYKGEKDRFRIETHGLLIQR